MSVAIDIDQVTAVLLASGWHDVAKGSFDLDSYEFLASRELLHGGGEAGICATGFSFTTTEGDTMSGPLTAVLAVRHGTRA